MISAQGWKMPKRAKLGVSEGSKASAMTRLVAVACSAELTFSFIIAYR